MDAERLPAAEEAAKHVTIWNRHEHRKIAGNAAPLRRNLARYLKKHPECEEYNGQDKDPSRAPIDPVTGERILHLNEHVPIWHTLENRKVTGNAAPLRKNLEAYLRKHPHCEVYSNQDKAPAHRHAPPGMWAAPLGPQPPTRTLPTSAATLSPAVTAAANANPVFRRSADSPQSAASTALSLAPSSTNSTTSATAAPVSAPMRNPFYENIYPPPPPRSLFAAGRQPHPTWGHPAQPPFAGPPPPPAPPPASFSTPTPAQPVPSAPQPATPSYSDMVSSWSNQPEWTQPYPPAAPGSFGGPPLAVGTPQPTSLFSTHMYNASALDGQDNNINGIPIPGGVARDRSDVVMGASMGASLGTSAHLPGELAHFLGATPRSMEHDSDLMQFSPSNYLSIGPLSGRSPPLRVPHAPAHTSTTLPHN